MTRRRKNIPQEPVIATIENLSHDGRGVAHVEGKTVFIFGALPAEKVMFRYLSRQSRYDEGTVVEVLEASPQRVSPRCQHFGVCGGCNLQHLEPLAQIQHKQATLLEHFQHIGKVEPEEIVPPLRADVWGYRRKARLGVKFVRAKQLVFVGFREHHSGFLTDIRHCDVLHPLVGAKISALRDLIEQLEAKEQIAQFEVAIDDTHAAIIIRNLTALSDDDQQKLIDFAKAHDFYFYLQPGKIHSVTPLYPPDLPLTSLHYQLPTESLSFTFAPYDFTQVNTGINQQMIPQAIEWLAPQANETVLDLFCGLGNFTLPLARRAMQVIGVEGDNDLLLRAEANAHQQNIHNVHYYAANLADKTLQQPWMQADYEKILLDPPRSGALEIIQQLPMTNTQRIVYVSCNPATLARDAGELVNTKGFRLVKAGVMDMFPHTAHVESIALFVR
ncbi:23S rRNA (uracil(1939)-C(5))-methyltransferase RlmD [Beggiatoa leptomitoformis]|uniref:23S rRNA (uracil(1939)-C(5))-methyltransferase RlmD n=1 Tax=Beggiatoa leptomitoformis TaxID=288004 RepID=A0A2N9YBR0_9GAMM|nr:23S rRNA (uracil(1939)-C(5))-methyltransferase RlmD [Beggiatoa leptomitoformis]ALG66746.1 23S rRNA (uracil(1939)-C(5))-methyltransferase RlmD [Beggiatoa leptomitoformis]AUI67915.1 23S rRNA (uracil(1939)-C(5))-methyltransferase RlmD [Beggiatoa leptomitoformis]